MEDNATMRVEYVSAQETFMGATPAPLASATTTILALQTLVLDPRV